MTFVITQGCCNDAACVRACPVNCIHPTPGEPGFGTAEMLYIDPAGCIDCGACVPTCPVSAIEPDYDLSPQFELYPALNAQYFVDPAHAQYDPTPFKPNLIQVEPREGETLRVAIIGSGPAGTYAAEELLSLRGVDLELHVFERLPTPLGLIRSGVAPDHQQTKDASTAFSRVAQRKNVHLWLNVTVGRDITLNQLQDRFDAVVIATGAASQRPLGLPGEDLPGSHSAADFVGWYNAHPDHADRAFDLSHERAVVVGNGNVALDIARILLMPLDELRRTDIADHALTALSDSNIREVVVLGRRGAAQAAFSTPELIGLTSTPGLEVVVGADDLELDSVTLASFADVPDALELYKVETMRDRTVAEPTGERFISLRFLRSPEAVTGADHVEGLVVRRTELVAGEHGVEAWPTDDRETIETGLVINAAGFRADPVPGVPFDERRGTVANVGGRVSAGLYATGWIKRGATGVIGTNRHDARETVTALMADWNAGYLGRRGSTEDLVALLPERLDLAHWRAIDAAERAAGRATGRPRVKVPTIKGLLEVAASVEAVAPPP